MFARTELPKKSPKSPPAQMRRLIFMTSPILQRGYKANLKRELEDAVTLGVDYRLLNNKYLTRDEIREMITAIRTDDDGEVFEDWMLKKFPEAIDEQLKTELDLARAAEERGETMLDAWADELTENNRAVRNEIKGQKK